MVHSRDFVCTKANYISHRLLTGSTLGLSHPLFVSCGSCLYFGDNCSRRNAHLYFFY